MYATRKRCPRCGRWFPTPIPVGPAIDRVPDAHQAVWPDDCHAVISRNVKRLRLMRGWTQKELARRCGIARNVMSRLEKGRRPWHVESVCRVAQAFGVLPGSLLVRDPLLREIESRRWTPEQRGRIGALMAALVCFGEKSCASA